MRAQDHRREWQNFSDDFFDILLIPMTRHRLVALLLLMLDPSGGCRSQWRGEMKAGLPNAIIEMGSIVFGISRVL